MCVCMYACRDWDVCVRREKLGYEHGGREGCVLMCLCLQRLEVGVKGDRPSVCVLRERRRLWKERNVHVEG